MCLIDHAKEAVYKIFQMDATEPGSFQPAVIYVQQAIDAALAEKAEKVQGLVDAVLDVTSSMSRTGPVSGVGMRIYRWKTALVKALSTFRAGKPAYKDPAEGFAALREVTGDALDGVDAIEDEPTLPAEVVKILRACEWVPTIGGGCIATFCPCCLNDKRDGHTADCEYAALLAPCRKEQENEEADNPK